jgi:hypothetical protein
MLVVLDPDPNTWALLRSRFFRPAKKSRNWYRFYDIRLRGDIEAMLAFERLAQHHNLRFQSRSVRRTHRPPRKTLPSASRWLKGRDKHLGAG